MHPSHFFFGKLKDIATRVIAREVNIQETPVSKIMTKNPVFVLSDTLAVEALQKMVLGWYILVTQMVDSFEPIQ